MLQDADNFDVDAAFEAGLAEADRLWERLGAHPDFTGMRVLELGSGLGFLSAAIALKGAAGVVGLDIWEPRVEYARARVRARFPGLDGIEFTSTRIEALPVDAAFDAVVSQNAFEHIEDVPSVLAAIRRVLKPGGRAFIGFSPLYHSPFGDHGELRAPVRLPWLHLLAGERRVVAAYNRANQESARRLVECGYNGLKPADFRAAFEGSGLEVERLRVNPTEGRLKSVAMSGFSLLARAPGLEPYFTVGMYAVLRRPRTH